MKNLWLLSLLIATAAQANIGSITELSGTAVEIRRGNSTLKATKETKIESNDTVSVGSNTNLTITFSDGSTAKITPNSKLVIDDFVYDPKGSSKANMRVALGTVRMASGGIAKQNSKNVNINTPTAAIAVRGTDFAMTVSELGESTVVLLPTCPDDKMMQRIELPSNCTCGAIDVMTSAGKVSMESPFYATHVMNSQESPLPPVRVDPQIINATGEGSLNRPQALAAAIAENNQRKEEQKIRSIASSDEQRAAKDSNREVANRQSNADSSTVSQTANSQTTSEVKTAEADPENPCWPFTSCGNEKGFNWYRHDDTAKGNVIHIRSEDRSDNTTYNISVNSNEISQRIVGNGSNIVTIRQWNK